MAKIQTNSKKSNQISFKINDEIFGNTFRLVGDNVENGIVSASEARADAERLGMDLILINPNANPPIVKIANYEKMIYEMKKNAKKNKQAVHPLKEVQLSVNITEHDMATKANNARRFIEDGSKVKVVLKMRGRELARREDNKKSILTFITMLDDIAIPESMPKDEGNRTIVILKKK